MSSPAVFPPIAGMTVGKVVGIAIGIALLGAIISYFANRYFYDKRYLMESSLSQGNFLTQSALDSSLEQLKQTDAIIEEKLQNMATTDMVSQQMKNTLSLTSNFFRSIGFVRISPVTLLLSPVTSGQTTGFGGLPSCISKGSPLYVLHGSSVFVDKVMAVKDDKPTATVLEAIFTAVKTIGTESFRWRRQTAATLNPYQTQLKANLTDRLPTSTELNALVAADKTLLSTFASKYCFVIDDFDATGFPIVSNLAKLYPTTTSTTTGGTTTSTTEPMFAAIDKTSDVYKSIVMDIYRFYPTILNKC